MTLQDFGSIIHQRIPTPSEFVAVVRGQGWDIAVRADGKAFLKVKSAADPLAVALAKMLGREPYRTNVLTEILTAKPAEPAAPAFHAETCQKCNGIVFAPDEIGKICDKTNHCPYWSR